jgi:hypothetical protein
MLLAASPRLLEVLNAFNGWNGYPLEVIDGFGELVPGYRGIAITGRCGRLVSDVTRIEGPAGQEFYVGLHFPVETWSGDDIFLPRSSLRIVITRKLRDEIVKAKIRNITIENLTEVRLLKTSVDSWMRNKTGPYVE